MRSDQARVATLEENLFARPLTDATRQRLARAIEICPELADAILNPQAPQGSTVDIDAYSEIGDWFYLQDNHIETWTGQPKSCSTPPAFDTPRWIKIWSLIYVDLAFKWTGWTIRPSRDNTIQTISGLPGALARGAATCFSVGANPHVANSGKEVEDIVRQARLTAHGAEDVLRIGLANYFAGALVMPYTEFLQAARAERYDLERLQRIFHVSLNRLRTD